MLSMLGKHSADKILNTVFFCFFSQKIGFDISYKLSPLEIICTKCQNLFSRENKKKNIANLLFAELAKKVVKVHMLNINKSIMFTFKPIGR